MKTKKETVSQKALRLLSSVPQEDFITNRFTDQVGKCCAIGHYQRLTSEDPTDYEYRNCSDRSIDCDLREVTTAFIFAKHGIVNTSVADVNNDVTINGYTEPVIKDRVIHLLEDMVKDGL